MALHGGTPGARADIALRPQLVGEGDVAEVPRYRMPEQGMDAEAAYYVVHDELMLDGNPRLNLATFVTTWMEPQARLLMDECLDRNIVDKDEYPQSAELEERCVRMLAVLQSSAPGELVVDPFCGTGVVGVEARSHERRFLLGDIDLAYLDPSLADLAPAGVVRAGGPAEVPGSRTS